MNAVAKEFIKPNSRVTAFERLEIYNRQYWFRVQDCLYEDYPGLRAILGERKFSRLAQRYLERFPSESFTLRNLGRNLETFIRDEPRFTQPRYSQCLDMARLEWAHVEAFDERADQCTKYGAPIDGASYRQGREDALNAEGTDPTGRHGAAERFVKYTEGTNALTHNKGVKQKLLNFQKSASKQDFQHTFFAQAYKQLGEDFVKLRAVVDVIKAQNVKVTGEGAKEDVETAKKALAA